MGYFVSETVIKEIKGRLNILNLIETYLSLKRSGRSYVGLCPFHDEKTPSFHVNDEKGVFHCFGCGAGGDVFGFVMRYKNLTFAEAVAELSKQAGI
ncbi:MAG: dnaG, partial [Candidatus Dadabacteria bacterium]|nr:dnaG [Candidatus Dadabacteria bacterium]